MPSLGCSGLGPAVAQIKRPRGLRCDKTGLRASLPDQLFFQPLQQGLTNAKPDMRRIDIEQGHKIAVFQPAHGSDLTSALCHPDLSARMQPVANRFRIFVPGPKRKKIGVVSMIRNTKLRYRPDECLADPESVEHGGTTYCQPCLGPGKCASFAALILDGAGRDPMAPDTAG